MNIGDYVRTEKGIAKIIGIFSKEEEPYEDAKYETDTYLEIYYDSEYIGDDDIIKSSPNIIDLIEVGDYVNGEKVINIMKKHEYLEVSDEEITIDKEDIKSIVTKEQFSSMKYKIGE